MAGGPSTPELVVAAGRAGSLGFLAGGYKAPDALAGQISAVRAAGVAFGVNLFAPNPVPIDPAEFRRYATALGPVARAYEIDLTDAEPVEDDDHWAEKIALLLADPVPVVSFTFGLPDPDVVTALQGKGTYVIQSVTSADEARRAAAARVDAVVVQAPAAGGHSATLTPDRIPKDNPLTALLSAVRSAVPVPLIAAGGLATPEDVAAALGAGAAAAMVGTLLLRAPESGASAPYKAALADPARTETVLTRAFSGRPARALRNAFTDRFTDIAPAGYPALHHLTSPLRKAATAGGDPDGINIWAGTGFRHATTDSAGDVLTHLASRM
jgi:NAD(P)H-dependent flavin oxidoreductase YrpB (nitropropane dioxygenase family)